MEDIYYLKIESPDSFEELTDREFFTTTYRDLVFMTPKGVAQKIYNGSDLHYNSETRKLFGLLNPVGHLQDGLFNRIDIKLVDR